MYPNASFKRLLLLLDLKTIVLFIEKLKIPDKILASTVEIRIESKYDNKIAKIVISNPKLSSDDRLNLAKTKYILAESSIGLKCESELSSI